MKKSAIIGMGPMGFRHLEAYKQAGVQVVAVCDLREDIKEKLPKSITFYTDYNTMLNTEKLDIVSVVTTGPYHAKLTIACAEKNVAAVLCEKPMATSIADAQKMIDACKMNNTRLGINHVFREWSIYQDLAKMLKEGIIGKVRHIHAVDGGGRLGCTGTHHVDTIRLLTNSDISSVIGFIDKFYEGDHKERKIYDPGGQGLFHFKNGVRATLELGNDIGTPELLVISGSMGRIIIDKNNNTVSICARSEEDKKKRLGEYDLPLHEIKFEFEEEFDTVLCTKRAIEKLLTDQKVACSGEDGLKAVEAILALHISDKKGNVNLDLPYEEKEFSVDIT